MDSHQQHPPLEHRRLTATLIFLLPLLAALSFFIGSIWIMFWDYKHFAYLSSTSTVVFIFLSFEATSKHYKFSTWKIALLYILMILFYIAGDICRAIYNPKPDEALSLVLWVVVDIIGIFGMFWNHFVYGASSDIKLLLTDIFLIGSQCEMIFLILLPLTFLKNDSLLFTTNAFAFALLIEFFDKYRNRFHLWTKWSSFLFFVFLCLTILSSIAKTLSFMIGKEPLHTAFHLVALYSELLGGLSCWFLILSSFKSQTNENYERINDFKEEYANDVHVNPNDDIPSYTASLLSASLFLLNACCYLGETLWISYNSITAYVGIFYTFSAVFFFICPLAIDFSSTLSSGIFLIAILVNVAGCVFDLMNYQDEVVYNSILITCWGIFTLIYPSLVYYFVHIRRYEVKVDISVEVYIKMAVRSIILIGIFLPLYSDQHTNPCLTNNIAYCLITYALASHYHLFDEWNLFVKPTFWGFCLSFLLSTFFLTFYSVRSHKDENYYNDTSTVGLYFKLSDFFDLVAAYTIGYVYLSQFHSYPIPTSHNCETVSLIKVVLLMCQGILYVLDAISNSIFEYPGYLGSATTILSTCLIIFYLFCYDVEIENKYFMITFYLVVMAFNCGGDLIFAAYLEAPVLYYLWAIIDFIFVFGIIIFKWYDYEPTVRLSSHLVIEVIARFQIIFTILVRVYADPHAESITSDVFGCVMAMEIMALSMYNWDGINMTLLLYIVFIIFTLAMTLFECIHLAPYLSKHIPDTNEYSNPTLNVYSIFSSWKFTESSGDDHSHDDGLGEDIVVTAFEISQLLACFIWYLVVFSLFKPKEELRNEHLHTNINTDSHYIALTETDNALLNDGHDDISDI